MRRLFSAICATGLVFAFCASLLPVPQAVAQVTLNTGPGFKVSWTLDPRAHTDLFPRGPAFGARSVQAGMDFDRDGHREFLFTTDETLAPGGPDPGVLDVYLYENTGNDSYEHVWHYSMPEGTNSLPALAWGDMDQDGLFEIYFGVPTLNQPNKLFVFEQAADFTFPDTPTLTWDFGRDPSLDFRPSGFQLADVDDDGKIELITQSRTSSRRELVVASLATNELDEFATFNIEFEAGNDILGGGGTYDVAVVDFDGDGKKEIWYNTWNNWSMSIFEADSADHYSLQADLDAIDDNGDPGSFNSHDMFFHDVDGDGALEAWLPMTNGVLYFIDDLADISTLTADNVIAVGTYDPTGRARGGSVGDIDNDGRPDIVATHGTSEKISRIEYQEIGSPADSSSYDWSIILDSSGDASGERYYPLRIAPVDLDGDGLKEIVATNLYASDPGQPIIVILEYDPAMAQTLADDWENPANMPWTPGGTISLGARSVYGGMDLDQDGKKEVMVTNYSSRAVNVFEYAGDGTLDLVWSSPEDTSSGLNRRSSNPRTVRVGDLDGDGKGELVFPLASEPSGWYVYEWDGVVGSDNYGDTYSSIIQTEVDTCCGADFKAFLADHEGASIIDIDGDGKQEFIVGIRRNAGGGKRGTMVSTVEGDIEHNAGGSGFETWTVEFYVDQNNYGGGSPYPPVPADLDGDGSFEIVNPTWNNFNFYNIDVTGPDAYAVADPASATKNFKATAGDHVALFSGGAGDVDGDGDDEVYFPDFESGHLWVVDYKAGDDVLAIDGTHVVKIAENVGSFNASVFDVDKNGKPNILVGSSYPRTITSTELVGADPRNPADYQTRVIYTGEASVRRNIVVRDSAGVVTTTSSNTGAFATKTQAKFKGNGLDFDADGNWEVLTSFQSVADSITTTTYTWNGAAFDTTVTKTANEKPFTVMLFEFTGMGTGVESQELTLITPNDYQLYQNYPNPFNPSTTIEYVLPLNKQVSVKIYNIMGQVVKTLVDNQTQQAGRHKIIWNGLNDAGIRVATGTYIYALEFGNFKKTKRMMLIK